MKLEPLRPLQPGAEEKPGQRAGRSNQPSPVALGGRQATFSAPGTAPPWPGPGPPRRQRPGLGWSPATRRDRRGPPAPHRHAQREAERRAGGGGVGHARGPVLGPRPVAQATPTP